MQADKSVTLNEQVALKERQTNQARQKARDAERATRKVPNEKIYDLTVENAAQSGLPVPESLTTTNYTGMTNGVVFSIDTDSANYFETNAAAKNLKAEVKTLPTDPTLDETENILQDYISLMKKNDVLIANH